MGRIDRLSFILDVPGSDVASKCRLAITNFITVDKGAPVLHVQVQRLNVILQVILFVEQFAAFYTLVLPHTVLECFYAHIGLCDH